MGRKSYTAQHWRSLRLNLDGIVAQLHGTSVAIKALDKYTKVLYAASSEHVPQ